MTALHIMEKGSQQVGYCLLFTLEVLGRMSVPMSITMFPIRLLL